MTSLCFGRGFSPFVSLLAALFVPAVTPVLDNISLVGVHDSILPDTEGAIAEITLHYDPELREELEPVYYDLFLALSDDVRVRVFCPSYDAAEEFVLRWGDCVDHRHVDVINVGLLLSIWARDRYLARQSAGLGSRSASFVPPPYYTYEEDERNDLFLQWILYEAEATLPPVTSWLHLEGGNVVSNGHLAFVGSEVFHENHPIPRDLVISELHEIVGRDLLVIADRFGEAPWEHIDMFLTPIGDNVVLVASQELGENLLWNSWDAGDANGECLHLLDGASSSYFVEPQLDDIAEALKVLGYRVFRLPAIFNDPAGWVINYNNVLMENRGGRRIVYLPVYDLPALDRLAEAIYYMEGFEVRTIDVSKVYVHGGAIRCIANVTERRYSTADPDSPMPGAAPGIRLINLEESGAEIGFRGADQLVEEYP